MDLINKSPQEKRRNKRKLVKGLFVGGSTEDGINRFSNAEGELIFTPIFVDDEKRRVLQRHKGLRSKAMSNCLVSNLLLPANNEKMDDTTCSELN